MWNLQYATNEPSPQNRNRLTDSTDMAAKGLVGRMNWEFGVNGANYYT